MSLLAYGQASRGSAGGQLRVEQLGESDRGELLALIERDPLVNVVSDARVRASRTLDRELFAGSLLGVRADGALRAAAMDIGSLLPIGGEPADWVALAQRMGAQPRRCSSIVGRAEAVAAMWRVLGAGWGDARAVRVAQPLLVLDRGSAHAAPECGLRPMRMTDLERYLPAATAMFTEELGVGPGHVRAGSHYRGRVASLIAGGRAFGVVDHRGEVIFKADLGTVTPHTCQVQGVWVRPDARGRGLATVAMGTVLHHALTLAPTVSLYVNNFNVPARRLYARLGMTEVSTLSTILF